MDVNWDPVFGALIALIGLWVFRIGRRGKATSGTAEGGGRIESAGGLLGVLTGTLLVLGTIG